MWKQTRFPVTDSSSIGEIRRFAVGLAEDIGFDEVLSSRVAIIVTELATNLLKHATAGQMMLSISETSIDILAIDKGPGMSNVQDCINDGFSTQGTAGNGLGAIKRGAHFFDLYTQPGKGTVVYARFDKDQSVVPQFEIGSITRPYKEEKVCGDSWGWSVDGDVLKVILADGLGHGFLANEASVLAVDTFKKNAKLNVLDVFNKMHTELKKTRGAAISISELDFKRKVFNFCGVGNVFGFIYSDSSVKRCITHAGTVGVQLRKVQPFLYPLENHSILVMFSDGLSSHSDLKDYPGLQLKHPYIIAAVLYRDYGKITDDATIVVVKGIE